MYVLTSEQMRKADEYTSKEVGLSVDVLMERAAVSVVYHVKKKSPKNVLVVAGPGNNGADGIAVARILQEEKIPVMLLLTEQEDKYIGASEKQLQIYKLFGGKTVDSFSVNEYDCIVDAIYGIGFHGTLRKSTFEIISDINSAHAAGTFVVSVDIPSGVNADNGSIDGVAVYANKTVTFGFIKRGLLIYPGAEYTGKIVVAGIGITEYALLQCEKEVHTFTYDKNASIMLRKRQTTGNKGTFGKVLVVAGSGECGGACYLAAAAAYRSGAGLVQILTHENNRIMLSKQLPEAVLFTYNDDYDQEQLNTIMSKCLVSIQSIVLGPGLGMSKMGTYICKEVLKSGKCPLIVDADGINQISAYKELRELLALYTDHDKVALTPHPLELERFTGISKFELLENYSKNILEIAKKNKIVLVGKGAGSIVSDGINTYMNQTGNSGMATAGSGDVLAGMIGALAAFETDVYSAAVNGVFLHGCCGDYLVKKISNTYSMMAHDLIDALNEVMCKNVKQDF